MGLEKQNEGEVSEVDWSYKVLDALKDGLNIVAEKRERIPEFVKEFMENLPDVMEAVMNLVKEEHKGEMLDVIRAAVNAFRRREKR